jgi:outer membrane lipoprotein-sorting protein
MGQPGPGSPLRICRHGPAGTNMISQRNVSRCILQCVIVLIACMVSAVAPAASGQAQASADSKQTKAPDASPATASVDRIIDHYMDAVGGRAAWEKQNSRVSMGTIEIPSANLRGTVVIHEKAPNKILTIIIVAGSAFREGFDGTIGWAEDPQSGVREQTGAELAETRRQADFYSPFNVHEHYSKVTLAGSEKIDEHDTYVLEAALPEGGQPDKLYFDASSGLPVRLISQHHSPEGVAQFQEDFSDYREVDGITLPFKIVQTGGDSTFVVRISDVRHNVELDDGEFSKPAVQ